MLKADPRDMGTLEGGDGHRSRCRELLAAANIAIATEDFRPYAAEGTVMTMVVMPGRQRDRTGSVGRMRSVC